MPQKRKINVDELKAGMKVASPIYMKNDKGVDMLVARKDAEITDRIVSILKRNKVDWLEVYLPEAEDEKAPEAPPEPAPQQSKPPPLPKPKPPEPKIQLNFEAPAPKVIIEDELKQETIESISQLFSVFSEPGGIVNMTTAYHAVSQVEKAVDKVLEAVTDDPTGLIHISDLKSYDEYTYHHSMSVALLSIATGQSMGMDAEALRRLGKCAMMHDIGKQYIPVELINKPGRLTPEEFKIIKDHPTKGMLSLKNNGLGDTELWNAVMFHHEKVNGTGYPMGLTGRQIPFFAKIIAVADVYDAVTSYRSYRSPMAPAMAYELICSEVGTSFDYDVVKVFLDRLELHPIGSILELSDKRCGVVIDNEIILRPIIKLVDTGEELDLAALDNLTLIITKVEAQ